MGTLTTIDSSDVMLDSLHPAATQAFWEHAGRSQKARSGRDAHRVILSDTGSGFPRYLLHSGYSAWAAAREKRSPVMAEVIEAPGAERRRELHLGDLYRSGMFSPLTVGRSWIEYSAEKGITLHELARRIAVTPSVINHYISVVKHLAPALKEEVATGRLNFKNARALADIKEHEHQARWAAPFLDGRLSSVHVERLIGLAKGNPAADVDTAVARILAPEPAAVRFLQPDEPKPAAPRRRLDYLERRPADMKERIFALAAELEGLPGAHLSEVDRMGITAALRALERRLPRALDAVVAGGRPILAELNGRKAVSA